MRQCTSRRDLITVAGKPGAVQGCGAVDLVVEGKERDGQIFGFRRSHVGGAKAERYKHRYPDDSGE